MKVYNGIVELTVGPLAGKVEVDLVKKKAAELPQTMFASVSYTHLIASIMSLSLADIMMHLNWILSEVLITSRIKWKFCAKA